MPANDPQRLVERDVRSQDPSLSPEANRLLTGELREVVGDDHVRIPAHTPAREREAHGEHSELFASLLSNRPLFIVGTLALLVVGAVTTLTTGAWWAATLLVVLVVSCAVVAGLGALHLATETEHLAPDVAARLESEGVPDPDKVFTELIEEFAGATEAHGTAEVISSGANEQTVRPDENPALAAVEQRTSLTPSSEPGAAAGRGGAVTLFEWGFTAGLLVLTIVVAILQGGTFWLVPGIVGLATGAWAIVRSRMDDAREERPGEAGPTGTHRRPGDRRAELRRRLVPLAAGAALFVVGFMILMAYLTGAL
jgi:hypothetical protein